MMNYSRPEQEYYTTGFRNFLMALMPCGRTEVIFPTGSRDSRISAQDGIHTWFCRLVDNALDGAIERCAVEENMGVVAGVRYRDDLIEHICLQLVVAEADLETFYLAPETHCSYFRLDYDLGCLGPLFKEAVPHIHCFPEGAPRFSCATPGGNVIVDFFDFIYRNFYHDKWVEWARCAYQNSNHGVGANRDIFSPIEQAFKASQHQVLVSRYDNHLHGIKAACRELKDRLFSARIDTKTSTLLTLDT